MKKNNTQTKIIIASLYLLLLGYGALTNFLLLPITICYLVSISVVYYLGSKVRDIALNVGYIWASKWALFIISLFITGMYAPDVFLYAMILFIVFNTSVNPLSFMQNKGSS